jgi:hypothetical protein
VRYSIQHPPPISEEAIGVLMDQKLDEAYQEVEDKLFSAVKSALSRGSKALLGTYLNTLLSYPARPFDNEPIVYPNRDEVIIISLLYSLSISSIFFLFKGSFNLCGLRVLCG